MPRLRYPGKFEFERQEISEKAGTWSHAIALLDLYPISRAILNITQRPLEREQDVPLIVGR